MGAPPLSPPPLYRPPCIAQDYGVAHLHALPIPHGYTGASSSTGWYQVGGQDADRFALADSSDEELEDATPCATPRSQWAALPAVTEPCPVAQRRGTKRQAVLEPHDAVAWEQARRDRRDHLRSEGRRRLTAGIPLLICGRALRPSAAAAAVDSLVQQL